MLGTPFQIAAACQVGSPIATSRGWQSSNDSSRHRGVGATAMSIAAGWQRLREGTWNLTAPADGDAGQKRDQQRAKRRLAGYAAQNAQRHAGFSTLVDSVADAVDGGGPHFHDLR
jgi:hypothetical protein